MTKHLAKEPTYVPDAEDWDGPVCRVLGCSDDIERTMRPPNYYYLSALHPQGMWCYTISGYVDYEDGGRRTRIGPGHVLAIIQPARGSIVYSKQGLPWRRVYIGVTGKAALELFDYIIHQYGPVHQLPKRSKAVMAARAFCRQVKKQPKRSAQYWSVETFQFLNAWWSSCIESVPVGDKLENINLSSNSIIKLSHGSVKELAQKMGYSRSYLSRRLKGIWRRNPSEVLRNARLEEAKKLLIETRLPVREIADKAGFSSSASFCAAFKAWSGDTPLRFRHKHIQLR